MSIFAPKSILCAVDMSPASPAVLLWASLFAEAYGARVEFLHANWFEYPPYFLPSQTEELAESVKRNRALLAESLAKLVKENIRGGVPCQVSILEGHPAVTILHRAAETQPDLLVLGSHGLSGLARMRLGSVAESTIQRTSVPTLIVRPAEGSPVPSKISRILCPVNYTDLSRRSLLLAANIASSFAAQLLVMNTEEEDRDPQASRKRLYDWVPPEAKGRCELLEVVRQGNAAEQILLAAREHSVDLITLAAAHRRFLDFTVMGTTTERVVRHAHSPVLVLPAGMEAAK